MAKLIKIDGKSYRIRRGRLVEIPPEWLGKVTHPQTIKKRKSKKTKKLFKNKDPGIKKGN